MDKHCLNFFSGKCHLYFTNILAEVCSEYREKFGKTFPTDFIESDLKDCLLSKMSKFVNGHELKLLPHRYETFFGLTHIFCYDSGVVYGCLPIRSLKRGVDGFIYTFKYFIPYGTYECQGKHISDDIFEDIVQGFVARFTIVVDAWFNNGY